MALNLRLVKLVLFSFPDGKRCCWRDQHTPRLHIRLQEAGMPMGPVLNMFDFIDLDEGRLFKLS